MKSSPKSPRDRQVAPLSFNSDHVPDLGTLGNPGSAVCHNLRPSMVFVQYEGLATLLMAHEVDAEGSLHPLGVPLDRDALRRSLSQRGLMHQLRFLPANVVAVDPVNQALVWFTSSMRREIFFDPHLKEYRPYHGKPIPHPPLLWKVVGDRLFLASFGSRLPRPDSPLYRAPYPQITPGIGAPHLCGVKRPEWTDDLPLLMNRWQDAFFDSRWTSEGTACTTDADYLTTLRFLTAKARGKLFPATRLLPFDEAGTTAADFIAA